ncbi:MAG: hypothetical protein AAF138_04710 [Planctomycetota bacterium]
MRRNGLVGLLACAAAAGGAWIAGCASGDRRADLAAIYAQAAQQPDEGRNPVIVIPGILGSRLVEGTTNRVAWGAFDGDFANPEQADGLRLVAHPIGEGVALRDLRDDIVPDGALDRVRVPVFGIPVELRAYVDILMTLGVGGYRDQMLGQSGAVDYGEAHYTCFQYSYDWRRDIVESAKTLDTFIRDAQRLQMDATGATLPPRVDIVAHSMGGMVARYYLRYGAADLPADGSLPELTWAGAENIEHLIMVGTPNAGSIHAFLQLIRGTPPIPFVPTYGPSLLGTMPAVYQLLPRPRHGVYRDAETGEAIDDVFDAEAWERYGWGLLSRRERTELERLLPEVEDETERRRIALDHIRKCLDRARRVHAALDVEGSPPSWVQLHLIAGDAERTESGVTIDRTSGRVRVAQHEPGDGTVTRSSALMDERLGRKWVPRLRSPIAWNNVTFLFRDHLGLTQDPTFADNVLFLLLERPRGERESMPASAGLSAAEVE